MRWKWFRGHSLCFEMARVVAGDHLPFAAVTRPIPISRVAGLLPLPDNQKIKVGLETSSGLLKSDSDDRLIQSTPLAKDFHSCTVLLERSPGRHDSVYLQTARPIKPGEPLYLWFSTDLQALLGISFLSPNNIRGEKNYACNLCDKSFEYPNPLKIHKSLDCGRLKLSVLWQRLKDSVDINGHDLRTALPFDSILKLSLDHGPISEDDSEPGENPPSPALSSYSSPSPKRVRQEEKRPSSEPLRHSSAFKPYLPSRQGLDETSEERLNKVNQGQIKTAINTFNRDMIIQHQAAEIETLVSNLGQSKQGHLCLYCGKVYSRKYGLKIHIRTHTGFKPLKCKYCLRPFGDPSNLNKHVRLHSESDTPYRCEICRKMLVRRRDLERHMKARHNVHFPAIIPV